MKWAGEPARRSVLGHRPGHGRAGDGGGACSEGGTLALVAACADGGVGRWVLGCPTDGPLSAVRLLLDGRVTVPGLGRPARWGVHRRRARLRLSRVPHTSAACLASGLRHQRHAFGR